MTAVKPTVVHEFMGMLVCPPLLVSFIVLVMELHVLHCPYSIVMAIQRASQAKPLGLNNLAYVELYS